MTAKDFSKHIYDIVFYGTNEFEKTSSAIIEDIEKFLTGSVHPIDRNKFSKWGITHERSTPEECWPLEQN